MRRRSNRGASTRRRGNGSVRSWRSSIVSNAQLITIVVIALPALVFALWPLWRARGEHGLAPSIAPGNRRLELLEEKASAYRALKELAFDYEAGHLSEDDYVGLRDRYESRAAEALEALDAIGP